MIGPQMALSEEVTISGSAIALDGDTIRMGSNTIRLFGIDTPEMRSGGHIQRGALDDLLIRREVTCLTRGRDRHGRFIATCSVSDGPEDIGRWLLENGHASVYRTFTAEDPLGPAYDAAERRARLAGSGIWSISDAGTEPWWSSLVLTVLGGFLAGAAGICATWWSHVQSQRASTIAALNGMGSELTTLHTMIKEALKRGEDSPFRAKILQELPGSMTRYHSHNSDLSGLNPQILVSIDETYAGVRVAHWTNEVTLAAGKPITDELLEQLLEQLEKAKKTVSKEYQTQIKRRFF